MKRKMMRMMQKSFDNELSNKELKEFQRSCENHPELVLELKETEKLNHLLSKQQFSYSSFFAEKVMRRIESLEQTTAGQAIIYAFYRIALPGLAAAIILVMISLFNNGYVSFDSVSGLSELNSGYLSDFLLFNY